MGDGTQSTTILLIVAKKHPPRSKRGGYFFGRAQSLNLMTLAVAGYSLEIDAGRFRAGLGRSIGILNTGGKQRYNIGRIKPLV